MASYLRAAASSASSAVFNTLGGRFHDEGPEAMDSKLSEDAKGLLQTVFDGVDCSRIVDYHVHLIGQEVDRTGCYCHPSLLDGSNVLERVKANCFLSAASVKREEKDEVYIERLLSLCTHSCPQEYQTRDGGHGRFCALALDYAYTVEGELSREKTSLHIPNAYSYAVASKNSDVFIPTCSVHPYRTDAIAELQKWRDQGVRMIKWLPNAQDMNPGANKCDEFYDAVREYDMILLSHTGDEHALTAGAHNDTYGNPLLLKRALDKGCKVIMAHCATEGTFEDLENPDTFRRVTGVDLMIRLMSRPEYDDLLFADISAIIGTLRAKHIKTLLEHEEIHDRLVYGSDYPVPAINIVSSTKQLWMLGLITWREGRLLNEIYRYNPLVYDFAVKRVMTYNGCKFPIGVFQEHPKLMVSNWQQSASKM